MESIQYEHDRHSDPPTSSQRSPRRTGPSHENTPDTDVPLEKIVDTKGFEVYVESFPNPHAGQPIRQVDPTQKRRRAYPDVRALSDPEALEIAQLLMESGVSGRFRNRYLTLKRIRQQMPWLNNRAMLKDIDKLPHGPDWEVEAFRLKGNWGEEIVELWKRNPLDVIRALLKDKTLRKYLQYVPQRHYTSPDRSKRRRSKLWTADWLWNLQESIKDKLATIIACIVSSDETRLTNFAGDKRAHPVYFSIGNLPKRLRRRISKKTTVLIGYLPVPKLSCETNKDKKRQVKRDLFHQCLGSILKPLADACKDGGVEVKCSNGGVRRIYPVLASYVADFPEQCKVACVKQTHCPLCTCHPKTRGDPGDSPLRGRWDALQTLKENKGGPSARFEWLGLTGIDPFWADHDYVEIGSLLTPDLLHQMHKGVMKDHLIKWVTTILGKPIMDERYMTMPESHSMRHFKSGISSVSQWTGRELKEMTKVLLPAISDTDQRVVRAARALLDFMYLAHLGSMTDDDLDAMEDALRTFHNNKEVFQELGPVSTDKGFHAIPKIHMISHYMHLVRELGTPDGYNTKTSERLHIDFAKIGYQASNKVNATKQMALYIQRLEAIQMHAAYLLELAENSGRPLEDSGGGKRPVTGVGTRLQPEPGAIVDDDDDEEWDAWHDDDDKEDPDELKDARVRIGPVVNLGGNLQHEHRGQPWVVMAQPPEADAAGNALMFHPNPEHVLAKTPTTTASPSYIVREHGATGFLHAVNSFVAKEVPELRQVRFDSDSIFNLWSRARLFHSPPPYQCSEGPHTDVIRAQPQKVDQYNRICRPRRFDTALVLAYPQKTGIHRYRPARVRVIFELPSNIRSRFPEPLAFLELFGSVNTDPVPNLGLFTTTRSLVGGQRATLVVRLSAIRMACHLAPKYRTQEPNTDLNPTADTLQIFRTFYINIFASLFMYNLTWHWGQDGMARRVEDDDEEMDD